MSANYIAPKSLPPVPQLAESEEQMKTGVYCSVVATGEYRLATEPEIAAAIPGIDRGHHQTECANGTWLYATGDGCYSVITDDDHPAEGPHVPVIYDDEYDDEGEIISSGRVGFLV